MIKFINWFKGSLEDEKGTASFRRIYNWIIICLVVFIVLFYSIRDKWTMLIIYVMIILLVAGFLNTSVITTDNILRFFHREGNDDQPQQQPPQQADISGHIEIKPNPPQQ
jgi:diacylglycerol kinase